ncbi:MAG TPA: VanZ family protein, partial [Bacteroidota bacterium]
MKNFAQNQLPALVWIGIIFWLSSIHRIPTFHIPMIDKLAHTGFYGVLCGLSFRAFVLQETFPRLKHCALLAALLFTILYGITDEIHQLYVWGRTSDILDVTADAFGGLIFVIGFSLLQRRMDS